VQNEFLSSVSHELRTPLTSIRLFIDTPARRSRPAIRSRSSRCLTVIHQELGRLDGLVAKLLTLSRIESRHAAFDRRPVAVADIVTEALIAFEAIRFGSEVDLKVSLEPGLMVNGDQSRLAQALANLLSNAWKYTPPRASASSCRPPATRPRYPLWSLTTAWAIPGSEHKAIFRSSSVGRPQSTGAAQVPGWGWPWCGPS